MMNVARIAGWTLTSVFTLTLVEAVQVYFNGPSSGFLIYDMLRTSFLSNGDALPAPVFMLLCYGYLGWLTFGLSHMLFGIAKGAPFPKSLRNDIARVAKSLLLLPCFKVLALILMAMGWLQIDGAGLEGVAAQAWLRHSPLSLCFLVSGVVLLGISQAFKAGAGLPVEEA